MRCILTMGLAMVAVVLAGCESSPRTGQMDQGRIISVRPAIPDGARSFVDQQNRLQQQQQKKAARGKKAAPQPPGYGYTQAPPEPPKPTFGQRMQELFSAKKKDKSQANKSQMQAQNPAAQPAPVQPVAGQPAGQQP